MSKSLTDLAKSILMNEGQVPSVSAMDNGDPNREAKAMNPNRATLRPKSQPTFEPEKMKNEADDLGGVTPTSGPPKENMGAKGSAKASKDNSKSASSAVASQPMKKAPMNEDADDEIELSEELEDFINSMIEEGATEEEIAKAIDENFELVEEDAEQLDETSKKNAGDYLKAAGKARVMATEGSRDLEDEAYAVGLPAMERRSPKRYGKFMTPKAEVPKVPPQKAQAPKAPKAQNMKEHVDALLAGEELSEDFRVKAETIFESAVAERVEAEVTTLEEAYAEALAEEVANIQEALAEEVDNYLDYVIEQWIAENEVAIESGLRSELTEEFISGLRNLFAEHYIDVPESKVSIVEELGETVEALEAKLNEEIERNVALTKTLNESRQTEILFSACDGLTRTQAEKLKSLAENLSFNTPEDFANKLEVLKESYFTEQVNHNAVLDTNDLDESGKFIKEEVSGPISAYVKVLAKQSKP
jgi:hypothetical protein